ncbi:MAG TPA: NADH-quinone oxidoreductase subunit H [Gemmatimonadales bacterium]|nr:NADH-quinone oxidoreductase subunit H [Gemmatimonadales bacterium]
MAASQVLALALVLVLAPLLPGVIQRTKSVLAGRQGPPVLQLYADLARLLRKGMVSSTTTSLAFRVAPAVFAGTTLVAAALLPLDGRAAPLRFAGDVVAFAGLLALGRFALVLAALDTGSSFEGMGASREATFAALVEPGLFLCFAALGVATGSTSLTPMLAQRFGADWAAAAPALVVVGASLSMLTLAENGRVPVDDPATHLELTMIHEVMILDHSGPDLALILYAGAVKLALFGAVLVSVLVPRGGFGPVGSILVLVAGLAVVGVGVGLVESVMARLRLSRVPQFLVATAVLSTFAIMLLLSAS